MPIYLLLNYYKHDVQINIILDIFLCRLADPVILVACLWTVRVNEHIAMLPLNKRSWKL